MHTRNTYENKKAFQSNANRPFSDTMGFIVNKFEHVGGGVGFSAKSKLNKCEYVAGGRAM